MANPKLEVEISARLDNIDREFTKLAAMSRETTNKVEASFKGMSSSIKGIAGGLAGYFSADMFLGMIKGAVDAQDHLNDLSKSTALSVETLAGIGSAAKKSGSDLDSIADSVRKLSINMGKDAEKFKAIGISAKDPIEAFKQLADVYNAIEDPQERAAFAAAALGKSWAGAAPLLAEGGKRIGEMVEHGTKLSKVTQESADAADKLNDQLVDLETSSQAAKTVFANLLVPSLSDTAKAMQEAAEKGNPLLALLRGFAGLGKLPFDLAFGNVDMGVTGQIKDLEKALEDLQSKRESYNPFVPWGESLTEIDRQILIAKNQLEALSKYKDKITPSSKSDAGAGRGKVNPSAVQTFLKTDSTQKQQISDGERLIAQLKDRLLATENLTEVEKLEAQFNDEKYRKITAGEREAAFGIATQIDARKSLITELDAELARMKEITKEFDAQDSRLASLVGGTDIGKNSQNMLDEALAESALNAGKIDQSTYDQIIAKFHEVKDEGKDAFAELQSAIEGWGKSSAEAIVDFAVLGKTSFKDMANSIISDMARMVVQQSITKPLAEGVSGLAKDFFSSGGFSSLFSFNADGNVYNSPGLSAYSGSVVSKPTVFPFAKGIGLMGEDGDEGIFPLKRGPDGKLGITASGVGAASMTYAPNITIDARGADAGVEGRLNAALGKFLAQQDTMVKGIMRGALLRNGTKAAF